MIFLKQSTASQEVPLGYFLDSTDGDTEETGLTISNTDIKIWKAGATTLANKNSGGATHISNGIYYAILDATDTDTLGSLVIFVHESGALSVRLECVVLAANVYDSLIGGGDTLEVDATAISGDTTAANNCESFFDGTGYAGTGNTIPTVTNVTNQVTADVTAISGDSAAADNLELDYDGTGYAKANSTIGTCTTNTDMVGTNNAALASVCTEARLSELDAANLPLDVDAILTDTSTTIPAQISGLNDPTAASVADAVWDEAKAGHVGAGSFGEEVQAHSLSSEISALNDVSTAQVQSSCDAAITANTDINNIDTGVNNIEAKLPTNFLMGSSDQNDHDTDIDAILVDTSTTIPAQITALNDITVADIIAGVADGAYDLQEMLRLITAACVGKSSGGGSNTLVFRNTGDSKNRITATVDANGNRTAMTLDAS